MTVYSSRYILWLFLAYIPTTILIGIVFIWMYAEEPERPHRHKQVFDRNVGITTYYVTYCYDTQMQVNVQGDHFESERAAKYFNKK